MPESNITEILKQFDKPATNYGAGLAVDRETELQIRAVLEKQWAEEAKAGKDKRKKK